jgi:esterase/lipase superfamily enzyme
MKIEHKKNYSSALGRDMEYNLYGTKGHPVLVFPSQNGRYWDYQDFKMVDVLTPFIDSGQIRLICIDSIDNETWSDTYGDEHQRIVRHEQWYHYIVDELIPEVRLYPEETFITTGCSMGGYHAANFFFRRPDIFDTMLSLSGIYHAAFFFPNYHDPLVYDNSPYDFLSGMPDDHPYWDIYRHRNIIMCVGQGSWEDDMLDSIHKIEPVLRRHDVPAWIDYWGHDVAHDWPWWRIQIVYFMEKIVK